jgi:hypothetical protein
LLPKGLNSSLGREEFLDKKRIIKDHLLNNYVGDIDGKHVNITLWLHTLEVFLSYENWDKDEIVKNKNAVLTSFEKYYMQ